MKRGGGVSLGLNELLEGDGEPAKEVHTTPAEVRALKGERTAAERVRDELTAQIRDQGAELEALKAVLAEVAGGPRKKGARPVAIDPKADAEGGAEEEAVVLDDDAEVDGEEDDDEPAPAGAGLNLAETAFPVSAFKERGVPQGYAWLRDCLKKLYDRYETQHRDKLAPSRYISGWYAGPGQEAAASLAIAVKLQFIERPYKAGTYYIRIRISEGKDGPQDPYFVCALDKAAAGADATAASNSKLTANMIVLRSLEELRVTNTGLVKTNTELRRQNDEFRDDINDRKDDNANQAREIEHLKAEIAGYKERGDPLISDASADAVGAQVLGGVLGWLNKPDKETHADIQRRDVFLGKMFEALRSTFVLLEGRPDVRKVLIFDAPEVYDHLTTTYNDLAREGGAEDRFGRTPQLRASADEKALLLEASGKGDETEPEDEMIAALAEADEKIVALTEANGALLVEKAELVEKVGRLVAAVEALEEVLLGRDGEEQEAAGAELPELPPPSRKATRAAAKKPAAPAAKTKGRTPARESSARPARVGARPPRAS